MAAFLKKEFEDSGFQVKEIVEDLLLVEDFISEDELNSISSIINNTEEKQWRKFYEDGLKDFCLKKFGRDDVENLIAEGKYEITEGWGDKNLNIDEYPISQIIYNRLNDMIKKNNSSLRLNNNFIQRMQSGVQLKPHADQRTDPSIQYAAVAYLNDDYNGGKIIFTKKDIKMHPKAGSLLIFPGNEEFEHGVEFVEDGPIRYVFPGFIAIDNFYEDNKY